MFSLVTVAVLFLVCLPPETVSQQCRSGVTDEIRQSVREQLRQGAENGTIPTVAVNCGQVGLVAKFSLVVHGCMGVLGMLYCRVCSWSLCLASQRLQVLYMKKNYASLSKFQPCTHTCIQTCSWELSLLVVCTSSYRYLQLLCVAIPTRVINSTHKLVYNIMCVCTLYTINHQS